MPITPESVIDICAKIVDGKRAEIEAVLNSPAARTSRYDRHTKEKLQYAILWLQRAAAGIRGIDMEHPRALPDAADSERLTLALAILAKMRPLIAATKGSQWRDQVIQQIDSLLPPEGK